MECESGDFVKFAFVMLVFAGGDFLHGGRIGDLTFFIMAEYFEICTGEWIWVGDDKGVFKV